MANVKYWEVETPSVVEGEKSLAKVYVENGKIQVFPKVANTKYGIGKGATLDLESMSIESLQEFQQLVNKAIENQMTTEEVQ